MNNFMIASEEKIETLADYAHNAWARWLRHLFRKSINNGDGSVTVPPELVKRWWRLTNTPYLDLPEKEKEKDREEARKILLLSGKNGSRHQRLNEYYHAMDKELGLAQRKQLRLAFLAGYKARTNEVSEFPSATFSHFNLPNRIWWRHLSKRFKEWYGENGN